MGYREFLGPQDKSLSASLSALSFLSPSAVFTPLAGQLLHNCLPLLRWLWTGVRGEWGLSGLLANSSLNSRLSMQDGLAQSAAQWVSQGPWPWLRSAAGVSSSFLCYSHRHWNGRGQERRVWGSDPLGSHPAPSGVLIPHLASPLRSNSLDGVGQMVGGPVPHALQNVSTLE